MKKHDLKDDIGYWLNRLRMQVHQEFEVRLAVYDVTIAQWCILLTLYNEDAASITELSKFIEVDKASISRVVERLLIKGLVTHQQGADRRSGHIQLTSSGRELVPLLIQAAKDNEQQFFGCLTLEEREQLRQLFHKLFLNLPSIQMSGWLSNQKEILKMNKSTADTIKQGLSATYKGEISFPEWVKTLLDAGIERYYADLSAAQVIYYGSDGTTYTENMPHPKTLENGVEFSEKGIVEAVRASQRNEIIYPEFLNRAIKAGTVSYTVYLLGKQVHYIGARGEIYIEKFPQGATTD